MNTGVTEPFAIKNLQSGEYYIGFVGDYQVAVDNVYGLTVAPEEEHDLMIEAFTGPTSGMINYSAEFTVSVRNFKSNPDNYVVYLLEDDVEVCTEEIAECNNVETVTMLYYPHPDMITETPDYTALLDSEPSVNTKTLTVKVVAGDYEFESEPFIFTAEEEIVSEEIKVAEGTGTNSYFPFRGNYRHTASQMVYTVNELSELSAGAKIVKIAFVHYSYNEAKHDFKLWIGNQTSTIPLTEETLSTEGLTLSYEGKYDYDATSKLGTFTLSEPFIYSGNGIEMIIASDATTYGSNSTWYGQLCSENQVFQRYGDLNDGTSAPEIFPNLTSKAFAKTLPTMIIYTESEPGVVTGYVTTNSLPVDGVNITFESNGRKYFARSDSDGSYNVTIKQT